jgi:hypothetical protein
MSEDEDPDNPFWTAQDWARARPASEVLPPEILAQLVRRASPVSDALAGQRRFATGIKLAA